ESPPPMMVTAPFFAVASATACATNRVPSAKGFFSNMPIGPFQMTVLAFAISALYASRVLGPMSNPSAGFCKKTLGQLHLVALDQALADFLALRQEEGVSHRTADQQHVGLRE